MPSGSFTEFENLLATVDQLVEIHGRLQKVGEDVISKMPFTVPALS